MKIWIAVLALAAGCSKDNPYYCAGNPDDNCALDGGNGDAPQTCTSSDECTGALGVCDTTNGVCVACTAVEADSCTGSTPVCATTNTCRGCAANSECSSGACMPDGSCADAATLLYVESGALSSTCAIDDPCSIDQAMALASGSRNTIVLAEGAYTTSGTIVVDKQVTVLGRGAEVAKGGAGAGPVFKVAASGKATFLYATIQNGDDGTVGHGLQCEAGSTMGARYVTVQNNAAMGVRADGCNLTIDGSTIRGNATGGIHVTGTTQPFTITNNVIYTNGGPSLATFGGVKIELTQFTNSRMEFNSIVENIAIPNSSYSGGVVCASSDFAPANNIIASNYVGGSNSEPNSQELGDCNHQSSIIQPDVTGLMFVDATPPLLDLHIADGSTARNAATVASPVTVDFEGDARTDGMKDIGADELK